MTSGDVIQLVGTLIWPFVVVFAAILYRDSIKGLLKRLKSVEVPGGFKGAFDDLAEKAVDKADAIAAPEVAVYDPAIRALINQTASQPWWAVHQAWRLVRWAAREASGGTKGDSDTTADRVGRLLKEGLVGDDIFQLTLTLRGLYYDMRQEPELVTSTAASDFVEAAGKLVQSLRQVATSSSTVSSGVGPATSSPEYPSRGPASSTGSPASLPGIPSGFPPTIETQLRSDRP